VQPCNDGEGAERRNESHPGFATADEQHDEGDENAT
jgi:hypothetical protein